MEQCRAFQEKIPWKQLGTAWLSAVQFLTKLPIHFHSAFQPFMSLQCWAPPKKADPAAAASQWGEEKSHVPVGLFSCHLVWPP